MIFRYKKEILKQFHFERFIQVPTQRKLMKLNLKVAFNNFYRFMQSIILSKIKLITQ